MNGSQGALSACTRNGRDCSENSTMKWQVISGMTSGGNRVNQRSQSSNGCAKAFLCQSGVSSNEAHLFPSTRFQAPLEVSGYLARASNVRGDLELAVTDRLGSGIRHPPIIHGMRINLPAS